MSSKRITYRYGDTVDRSSLSQLCRFDSLDRAIQRLHVQQFQLALQPWRVLCRLPMDLDSRYLCIPRDSINVIYMKNHLQLVQNKHSLLSIPRKKLDISCPWFREIGLPTTPIFQWATNQDQRKCLHFLLTVVYIPWKSFPMFRIVRFWIRYKI